MAVNQAFNQLHIVTKFNSIYQQTLKAKNGERNGKILKEVQLEKVVNGCTPNLRREEIYEQLTSARSVNSRKKSCMKNQLCQGEGAALQETIEEVLPSSEAVKDCKRGPQKTTVSPPCEETFALRNNPAEMEVIYVESSSDFEDIHSSPVRNPFQKFAEGTEIPHESKRTLTEESTEKMALSKNSHHEQNLSLSKKSRKRKKTSAQGRGKRQTDTKVKTCTDDNDGRMEPKEKKKRSRKCLSKSSKPMNDEKENNLKKLDNDASLRELNPKSKKKVKTQPKYDHDLLQKSIMPLSDALRISDTPFLPNLKPLFGKGGVLNQNNRTWQTIVDEG